MPRSKLIKKISNPLHFKGFKPIGVNDSPIILDYGEYEALRLSDFDLNGQYEASQIMSISRPPFSRIYESACRKVAQAFIMGKTIVFEGGKAYYDSEWYSCIDCGCWYNQPAKTKTSLNCKLCGSKNVKQYNENQKQTIPEDICECPECVNIHTSDLLCKLLICQCCNVHMKRRGTLQIQQY